MVVFVRTEPNSDGGNTIGSEHSGGGGEPIWSEHSGDDTIESEFGGVGGGVSGIFVVFKLQLL